MNKTEARKILADHLPNWALEEWQEMIEEAIEENTIEPEDLEDLPAIKILLRDEG